MAKAFTWLELFRIGAPAEVAAAVMGCDERTAVDELRRVERRRRSFGARSVSATAGGCEARQVPHGLVLSSGRPAPGTPMVGEPFRYVGTKDSGWRRRDLWLVDLG